jgi:hypothetical protein
MPTEIGHLSAIMSVLRGIRSSAKEVAGIAFLSIGLAWALYQLYGAWTFGVIAVPRFWPGHSVARLAEEPIWFWIGVACAALVSVVSPLLLCALVFELRSGARYFRRKETRPPYDDAIRQPFDDR